MPQEAGMLHATIHDSHYKNSPLGTTMQSPSSDLQVRRYGFDQIPLNRPVCLIDENWLEDYEDLFLLQGQQYENVGALGYGAVMSRSHEALDLTFNPNILGRFHEVSVTLPREAVTTCMESPALGDQPHIFVKPSWLANLRLRPYSAFALIDAIGVKDALSRGELDGQKLVNLRDRIDAIAAANPAVAFVSFADNLLRKANWFLGRDDPTLAYSYHPEKLIQLIPQIADAFHDVLGLRVYATITQGVNAYTDISLLHTSPSQNHISLNALGLPFAQLLAIDAAVRTALKNGTHPPNELYIDEQFYYSLRFRPGFSKHVQPNADYVAPMWAKQRRYFYVDSAALLADLELQELGNETN